MFKTSPQEVDEDRELNVLEMDFSQAFGLALSQVAGDEDCGGGFWIDVKTTSVTENVSHTFGQVPQHASEEVMELMILRVQRWLEPEVWQKDAATCPEGALAAIDLSIQRIDAEATRLDSR